MFRRLLALTAVLTVVTGGALALVLATGAGADTDISVKQSTLTDHECDSTEWHFVINQIDQESDAPASIHVTWSNGQEEDVPLSAFTGGVAHYTTTSNLDSTVTNATTSIYDGWDGQFNLSHGPCNEVTTTTTAPPTTTTQPEETTTTTTATTSPPTVVTSPPQTVTRVVTAQPSFTG